MHTENPDIEIIIVRADELLDEFSRHYMESPESFNPDFIGIDRWARLLSNAKRFVDGVGLLGEWLSRGILNSDNMRLLPDDAADFVEDLDDVIQIIEEAD